jgi:hypothetical protein
MPATAASPCLKRQPRFFGPTVKWITSAGAPSVHSVVHRAAQADFNVRAGQGRTGVILRRRPCFLAGRIGPKTATHPSNPRRLVICVSQRLPAECAF